MGEYYWVQCEHDTGADAEFEPPSITILIVRMIIEWGLYFVSKTN